MTLFFKYWLPVLGWMAVIFAVSGTPGETIPRFGVVDVVVKKGAHALAYAILALLCRRATGDNRRALLITVLYAISDEAHQLWVAGRYGQPLDVVIDTTGGLLGLWLTARWFGEKHE